MEAHKQSGNGFPSDLTDAQWARLEPLIPPAKPGGRPRQTDMRAAMNAIFYLLRTGCPWLSPRDPFRRARRSTTFSASSSAKACGNGFGRSCSWPCANKLGREASPTAAIIDSQSLKAAEKGGAKAGVKTTQWVMTPATR